MQFLPFINKDEENIRYERVANVLRKMTVVIFGLKLKLRASRPPRCRTVDGINNNNNKGIAQLFASSYKTYTSVPYNKHKMMKLLEVNGAQS